MTTRTSQSGGAYKGRVLRAFFDWSHPAASEGRHDEYTMEPADYCCSSESTETLRQWQAAWAPIADFDMGETEDAPTAEIHQQYEDLGRRALAGILARTPAGIAVSIEQHDAPRPDFAGTDPRFDQRPRP